MSAHTRRLPWWLLFLAFLVVPVVEIWTIVQVGQVVGVGWTILLLLAVGAVGVWLVRREGSRAWQALVEALAEGRMPHRELADGVLILLGGTLMITPGFVSDVVGVLLILPVTRPLGRRLLAGVISQRLTAASAGTASPYRPRGTETRRGPEGPGDVVTGEVVDR